MCGYSARNYTEHRILTTRLYGMIFNTLNPF